MAIEPLWAIYVVISVYALINGKFVKIKILKKNI